MRVFLRIAAGVVMAVSSIAVLMGVIGLFTPPGMEEMRASKALGERLGWPLAFWNSMDIS